VALRFQVAVMTAPIARFELDAQIGERPSDELGSVSFDAVGEGTPE
jgi:hypothetical protein